MYKVTNKQKHNLTKYGRSLKHIHTLLEILKVKTVKREKKRKLNSNLKTTQILTRAISNKVLKLLFKCVNYIKNNERPGSFCRNIPSEENNNLGC